MADRVVRVVFEGDSSDISRALRGIKGDLNTTSSVGSKFGSVLKAGALAAVAGIAAAGAAVVAFGVSAVNAAAEAQKVTDQTAAVIKSMGVESEVTAGHIANLSSNLSLMSGINDEAIQSGTNLLLTFANVVPIIDEATQLTLDMSVAMGTDMESAAIQVGKALNDPVKGLTALSRVGVSFTKKQEKLIESLVEEGKTLKAQGIIMDELEKQFGGSAKAQANAMDKVKVAIDNVKESIGKALLPIVNRMARRLSAFVKSEGFQKWLKDIKGDIKQFAKALENADWKSFIANVKSTANAVKSFYNVVKFVFGVVGEFVGRFAFAAVTLFNTVGTAIGKMAYDVYAFYTAVKEAIGRVVDWFSRLPDTIRSQFGTAGSWLVSAGAFIIQGLIDGLMSKFDSLVGTVTTIMNFVRDIPAKVWELLSPSKVMVKVGHNIMAGFVLGLKSKSKDAADAMRAVLSSVRDVVKEYKSSISESFGFDVTGMEQHTDANGNPIRATKKQIRHYSRGQVQLYRKFAHALQRVARMGAPPGLLQDLVAAGPEGGLAIAQVLANSPKLLKQVGRAEKRIDRFGNQTANVAGNQMTFHYHGNVYGYRDFEKTVLKAVKDAMNRKGGK